MLFNDVHPMTERERERCENGDHALEDLGHKTHVCLVNITMGMIDPLTRELETYHNRSWPSMTELTPP